MAGVAWLFLFGGLLLPVSPSPTGTMVLCTYGISFLTAAATIVGYAECRQRDQPVARIAVVAAAGAILLCFVALFGPAYRR